MSSTACLILRSAQRARLEGRTTVMQPSCKFLSNLGSAQSISGWPIPGTVLAARLIRDSSAEIPRRP